MAARSSVGMPKLCVGAVASTVGAFSAGPVALSQAAVGGSDEERALRKKKRKSKEDDRFNAVKSAIIKRLGDTCDVSISRDRPCGAIFFSTRHLQLRTLARRADAQAATPTTGLLCVHRRAGLVEHKSSAKRLRLFGLFVPATSLGSNR